MTSNIADHQAIIAKTWILEGLRGHNPYRQGKIRGADLMGMVPMLAQAARTGQPQPEEELPAYSTECYWCKDMRVRTDGLRFWVSTDCPHAGGYPVISTQLDIPSGRMVITDDLRPVFEAFAEGPDYDICYGWGQAATILAAPSTDSAILLPVGNTSPRLRRMPDGSISIANRPDEAAEDYTKPDGEDIGRVCTDLWWVSIGDGAEYDRRAAANPHLASHDGYGFNNIAVQPGIWQFDYFGLSSGFDKHASGQEHARGRWVKLAAA